MLMNGSPYISFSFEFMDDFRLHIVNQKKKKREHPLSLSQTKAPLEIRTYVQIGLYNVNVTSEKKTTLNQH